MAQTRAVSLVLMLVFLPSAFLQLAMADLEIPLTVKPAEKNSLLINGKEQPLPNGFEESKQEMARILLQQMGPNAYNQLSPRPEELTDPAQVSILGPFKAHEARLVETSKDPAQSKAAALAKGTPEGMVRVGGKLVPEDEAKAGDFSLPVPKAPLSQEPKRLRPVKKVEAGASDEDSQEAVKPMGADVEECKVLCQRFAMSGMGPSFEKLSSPMQCVTKCDEVFGEKKTGSPDIETGTGSATSWSTPRMLLLGCGAMGLFGIAGFFVVQNYSKGKLITK